MKRWLTLFALVLILISAAVFVWNQFVGSRSGNADSNKEYSVMTSTQLIYLLNNKQDLQIIDLREPFLFKDGHIPGAVNIPFDEFQNRMNEISPAKPVVFVCHTGPMGDVTSKILVEQGFKNVSNLKGGMAAWDGPVTK
ncbi:rhodanese-like domain-containing protein [Effusibacillus pohliae]|uniref:rhodanese-like domain-containing protein n=1 Tax=Effusibacillus pohliae TaxID=232270 RepID=UPI00036A6AE9|nr:rhodanese-like domain-containing protein [Effusibacillus pohliae]